MSVAVSMNAHPPVPFSFLPSSSPACGLWQAPRRSTAASCRQGMCDIVRLSSGPHQLRLFPQLLVIGSGRDGQLRESGKICPASISYQPAISACPFESTSTQHYSPALQLSTALHQIVPKSLSVLRGSLSSLDSIDCKNMQSPSFQ